LIIATQTEFRQGALDCYAEKLFRTRVLGILIDDMSSETSASKNLPLPRFTAKSADKSTYSGTT
jgi:hypothetical protein